MPQDVASQLTLNSSDFCDQNCRTVRSVAPSDSISDQSEEGIQQSCVTMYVYQSTSSIRHFPDSRDSSAQIPTQTWHVGHKQAKAGPNKPELVQNWFTLKFIICPIYDVFVLQGIRKHSDSPHNVPRSSWSGLNKTATGRLWEPELEPWPWKTCDLDLKRDELSPVTDRSSSHDLKLSLFPSPPVEGWTINHILFFNYVFGFQR